AHHATTADELIEACRIADGAISQCLLGSPDMTGDARVQQRKAQLLEEATLLLDAIAQLGSDGDPYTDADVLAQAVEIGLLDAPHLRGNAAACGKIVTRMVGGACLAVEPGSGEPIAETERVARALMRVSREKFVMASPIRSRPRLRLTGEPMSLTSTAGRN